MTYPGLCMQVMLKWAYAGLTSACCGKAHIGMLGNLQVCTERELLGAWYCTSDDNIDMIITLGYHCPSAQTAVAVRTHPSMVIELDHYKLL